MVRRLAGLDIGAPLELLVVEDGSTDGTRERLAELEKEFACLRVIEHGVNRGYGAALKTGFAAASNDVVVITDADGTYPEDRIKDLLDHIDAGAEMAVGARTGASVHVPLIRRPAKWALRRLASYLAGVRIPDLNSGLRAFRRELVLKYRPILPDGFSFTTTITLASLTNGHRVAYESIDYAQRSGKSKIAPIRDTLRFLTLILRTVVYFNPLKVFLPLGAVFFFGGAAKFVYDLFIGNLSETAVLGFLGGTLLWAVGLLSDQIARTGLGGGRRT